MKRRDLRILWSSNAPHAQSGYSVETRDILYRLVKDGWPIAISSFFGVQGRYADIEYPGVLSSINPALKDVKIRHYPHMADPFGSDALIHHAHSWKANLVITFQDLPPLNPEHLKQIPVWIPWVPIDKNPTPPPVLDRLKVANRIVTIAKFGQDTLLESNFTSRLIREGVDTEIFKPMDKLEARKALGLPDGDYFLWGMIGANKENPPRKGYQEAIEAFYRFSKVHEDARIIFLTQQKAPGNFPIREFLGQLGGEELLKKAWFVNEYMESFEFSPLDICRYYNAMDALLHPSQTEGFGLCIIEAQASGTPVIVNNCHSMPELVVPGVTGYICKTQAQAKGVLGKFTNDLSYVYPADVDSLVAQMENLYADVKKDEDKIAKACREHIVKNFNVEDTTRLWNELLEEIQDELLPLTPPEKPATI